LNWGVVPSFHHFIYPTERKPFFIMSVTSNNKNSISNKGWLVTIVGTCVLLALGVLYSWSVFKANIPAEWGWVDSQKSPPYSVACIVFFIMTLVGARLLGKFGPRVVISAGGVLAGLGVIISSVSTNPLVYALAFGGLLGSGIGFVTLLPVPPR
jgi:MFS family permease